MRAHKRDRARLKLPPLQLFQTCTPVGPDGGTTLVCDAGRSSRRRRRAKTKIQWADVSVQFPQNSLISFPCVFSQASRLVVGGGGLSV